MVSGMEKSSAMTDIGTERKKQTHRRYFGTARSLSARGFTLLELMIVMAIMGVLITIAVPNLKSSITRAREAVLREDLFQMRDALDQFYADNGKYPARLEDLVSQSEKSKSYLRGIPKDPFTGATDWITVALDTEDGGVFDVHSASPLVATDGTAYNTW
jgi:general secretion pathway protein G